MPKTFEKLIQDACFLHLNSEQISAMQHGEGPGLVLAVPGSGKTTLMLARTLFLVEQLNVKPSKILTMTFSKAAALDLNNRFDQVFKQTFPIKLNFSTIHRYCYGLLRKYQGHEAPWILIEGNPQVKSKRHLLAELYKEHMHESITEDRLEDLSNAISYVKNMLLHKDQFKEHGLTQSYLEDVFTAYEKIKLKHRWIDFDDMLTHALRLLQSNPHILNSEQSRYDYIQVDESQDISRVQYEIIKQISYPNNNLYMVADDDQSIYGFRGACPDIILNYNTMYPNTKTYTLSKNYRSTDKIINICNQLIKNNAKRHYKTIESVADVNHTDIHPVKIVTAETPEHQTNYIIDHLNRNDYGNTAILFRNNLSIIPVIEEFERKDIPFYIRDFNFYFFSHWIVKDIRSFFELSIIPTDIGVLERIYYKINAYISKKAIGFLHASGPGDNVFNKLCQYPELKHYQIEKLQDLRKVFSNISTSSPLRAIEIIENDLGYKAYLDSQVTKMGFSKEQIRHYFSHLKLIASNSKTLLAFEERLEYLKKHIQNSKFNNQSSAVTLSTMHGSKGLEFDTVFVIDATDGIIPAKKAIAKSDKGNEDMLEEERRLFYVSISRARYKLHIIQTRFLNGEYTRPSPFISELLEGNDNAVEQVMLNNTESDKVTLNFDFDIGDRLTHARFGPGILVTIDGDTLKIDFDDGQLRDLSYKVCAKNGLIALI